MKNIIYLLLTVVVLVSCNKETDYVTFSGMIANKSTDSLLVFNPRTNYSKVIQLKKDGTFKDTLKVVDGLFSITDSRNFALLYLKNGNDVTVNFDAKKFQETIKFSGDNTLENNFLKQSLINENKLFANTSLMNLPKKDFNLKISNYVDEFNTRLNAKTLDADFLEFQKGEIVKFKNYLQKDYEEKNYTKLYLGKGKASPKFIDYENFKGGTTSLDDLKGKYVYIDVWATWCQPCKAEIPYLQKIEKEYHNKNIVFVSVSLDEKRSYETWKSMVKDKDLGGIQLYAKGDKSFATAYRVRSIPRFILIDAEGNIINANAPRPSSPELPKLLNSLKL